MNTDKLFYSSPKNLEFTAQVLESRPDGKAFSVLLDKTAFFPGGGGQPADRGTLNDIKVLGFQEEGNAIWHKVSAPLEGDVTGIVDGAFREDYAQQHTGQHILSSVLYKRGHGTLSVHQGEEYTTIEIDTEDMDDEEARAIEDEANRVIRENRSVNIRELPSEEAKKLPLRRPPKVEGLLRVVDIEGQDMVACCGVHCLCTSDVGLIKIIGREKIRGHIRLILKIGNRAYADYRQKHDITTALSELFSSPVDSLVQGAEKKLSQLKEAEYALAGLREKWVGVLAEGLLAKAEITVYLFEEDEVFKSLVKKLADESPIALALVNRKEGDGRFSWAIILPEGSTLDFNAFRKDSLPLIEGKGGGRPPLYQGMGTKAEGIDAFFTAFKGGL